MPTVVKKQVDIIELSDHVIVFPKIVPLRKNYTDLPIEDLIEKICTNLSFAFSIKRENIVTYIDPGLEPSILLGLILTESRDKPMESMSFMPGPLCSDVVAAKEFQEFWQNKSEMRHIAAELRECVVWDEKIHIPSQIVDFVLTEKMKLSKNCFYHLATQFDEIIKSNKTSSQNQQEILQKEKIEKLSLEIREHLLALNSLLPANIKSISFQKELELLYNLQSNNVDNDVAFSKYCPFYFVQVFIELEYSGKWPKEKQALFAMKQLFLLHMYKLLSQRTIFAKYLPPNCVTLSEKGFIDIPFKQIVFRISLQGGQGDQNNLQQLATTTPKHPIYSDLCRLIRLWFSKCNQHTQFISSIQQIQLIQFALYNNNNNRNNHSESTTTTTKPPNSIVACFLLFLRFISKRGWKKVKTNLKNDKVAGDNNNDEEEEDGFIGLNEDSLNCLTEHARRSYRKITKFLLHWNIQLDSLASLSSSSSGAVAASSSISKSLENCLR